MSKLKTQTILAKAQYLADQQQHQLLTQTYNGIKSNLEFFCLLYKTHNKTTYKKYIYSKWGCLCCAKEVWIKPRSKEICKKISLAQKNKPKTYTPWLKGKTGSKHPSYKHGLGNTRVTDSKEIQRLKAWKQAVLEQTSFRCFLTNLKTTAEDPLVCHHLYSWSDNVNFSLRGF